MTTLLNPALNAKRLNVRQWAIQGHPVVVPCVLLELVIVYVSGGVRAFFAAGGLLFRGITLDGAEHSLRSGAISCPLGLVWSPAGTGMAGQPDLAPPAAVYGNLTPCGSTLWVRVKSDKSDMPFITIVQSLMRRRLVENILLSVRKICAVWPNLCHNILLVFGLDILWHLAMSLLNVSLNCGVLISSTSYSGFDLNLVQLIA